MTTAREAHLLKCIELANVALESQMVLIDAQRTVIKYYEERLKEVQDAMPAVQKKETCGTAG